MTSPDSRERQTVATASIMLGLGKLIDRLSCGLTIASFVGLAGLGVFGDRGLMPAMFLIGAACFAGLAELWFAARVAMDAALFHQISLAEDGPHWALLDGALTELRLLPESKAGRPAAPRIAGAFRLFRLQIITLLLQTGLIIAGAVAGAAR